MTPLRQRFVDDLRVRNRVAADHRDAMSLRRPVRRSISAARRSCSGRKRCGPISCTCSSGSVSWSMFNQTVCALRFLYGTTLGRPERSPMIPFGKRPKTLPCVLSPEEVARLVRRGPAGRERVLLQTTYACGLRLEELLHLQVARHRQQPHGACTCGRARGTRTGWCRCRRGCWRSCGRTGGVIGRATWLFPGRSGRTAAGTAAACSGCASRLVGAAGLTKPATHAHAAAQLRHAPARSGRRRADAAEAAGPQRPVDDGACTCTCSMRSTCSSLPQPARPARRAVRRRRAAGAPCDGGPAMTAAVGRERPALEVADVIRSHGEAFLAKYGGRLTADAAAGACATWPCAARRRWAATSSVASTAATSASPTTRAATATVPSARPWPAPAGWSARPTHLLPVEYSPRGVHAAGGAGRAGVWPTRRVVYDLLFQAARRRCARWRPTRSGSGAQVGVLMVLHTWGQNLHHHPHVHCVVTGGGLSCDARGDVDASPRWRVVPAGLLPAGAGAEPGVPRQVPGRAARGLRPRASCVRRPARPLAEPDAFAAWLRPLYAKDWVVYAKPPFGGPAQVLKYLARYTHRVAISNAPAGEARRRPGDVPLQGLRRRPSVKDDDACRPRSSCGASCSTCCRGASSRSATTASWPIAIAPRS